jgi:hypothetical protein
MKHHHGSGSNVIKLLATTGAFTGTYAAANPVGLVF